MKMTIGDAQVDHWLRIQFDQDKVRLFSNMKDEAVLTLLEDFIEASTRDFLYDEVETAYTMEIMEKPGVAIGQRTSDDTWHAMIHGHRPWPGAPDRVVSVAAACLVRLRSGDMRLET